MGNDVRRGIATVGEKISELAWTVGRDGREEARRQRRWRALDGLLGVVATAVARKGALKAWNVLTGEAPPVAGQEAREAMYARVSTYELPPGELDAAVRGFRAGTASLRRVEGAAAAYVLVDRTSGKALTLTLWESDDALRASEEQAERIRREAAGDRVRAVERYEIALHETFP
jgi:heme-degrading monooxygenase HmoA